MFIFACFNSSWFIRFGGKWSVYPVKQVLDFIKKGEGSLLQRSVPEERLDFHQFACAAVAKKSDTIKN